MRRHLAIGVSCFIGFVVLGLVVAQAVPTSIDRVDFETSGPARSVAYALTSAGRFPTYLALCAVALGFGVVRRTWLARAALSVAGLVIVWQTSDVAKILFHRARPPHPILAETSYGYPSGHADLAMFFYGLWAFYIWHTSIAKRMRVVVLIALGTWIAAIGWSRLALGAHYPSDVLGGYLYGAGWLALTAAIVARRVS